MVRTLKRLRVLLPRRRRRRIGCRQQLRADLAVLGVALLPGPLQRFVRARHPRKHSLKRRRRRRLGPWRHIQRAARRDGLAAIDGVQRQPLHHAGRRGVVTSAVHQRHAVLVRQRRHQRQLHLARHRAAVQLRQQRGRGGAERRIARRSHVERIPNPQRRQHVDAQSFQQRLQKAHGRQHAQLRDAWRQLRRGAGACRRNQSRTLMPAELAASRSSRTVISAMQGSPGTAYTTDSPAFAADSRRSVIWWRAGRP